MDTLYLHVFRELIGASLPQSCEWALARKV